MATDPNDFRGTYPFLWIVPLSNIATWVMLLLAPFFDATRGNWLIFVACMQGIYALALIRQIMRLYLSSSRTINTIQKYKLSSGIIEKATKSSTNNTNNAIQDSGSENDENKRQQQENQSPDSSSVHLESSTSPTSTSSSFVHAFIIPNYKEPIQLLQETLNRLKTHPTAREKYLVVLAMEQGEQGHEEKAQSLINQYSSCFRLLTFTSHEKQPDETRGKASNVSWSVEHFQTSLADLQIHPDDVLCTVMDADAELYPAYIAEVDLATQTMTKDQVHLTVFTPPVFFERNWKEVPAATRIQDFTWAALAFQNLSSYFGVGFPLSNYTIPLRLCQEMDYWDCNEAAIAEDQHTFLKAFFKSHGKVQNYPIYVPINMVNLDAGAYMKTLWARFIQAERHYRGVADLAYICRQCFTKSFNFRHFLVLLKGLEAFWMPPIMPWYLAVAGPFSQLIEWIHGWYTGRDHFMIIFTQAFGTIGLVGIIILMSVFEYTRVQIRRDMLGQPDFTLKEHIWYRLAYVWEFPNMFIYLIIPHGLASFKAILPISQGEYKVAEKVVKPSADSENRV